MYESIANQRKFKSISGAEVSYGRELPEIVLPATARPQAALPLLCGIGDI